MSVDPALDLDALATLVRPTLPPSLPSVGCPLSHTHAIDVDFIDGWMFWRRNRGYVSGSRFDCYARGHQRAICELCLSLSMNPVFDSCRYRIMRSSQPQQPSSDRSRPQCFKSSSVGGTSTRSRNPHRSLRYPRLEEVAAHLLTLRRTRTHRWVRGCAFQWAVQCVRFGETSVCSKQRYIGRCHANIS